jgi:hypothetical protein
MPLPDLPNYIVKSEDYHSAIASIAHPTKPLVFFASVVNPPGQVDTQYVTISRLELDTRTMTEVETFYARDVRAWLFANTDCIHYQDTGKYGVVALAISRDNLILSFTSRINGFTVDKWRVIWGGAL